MEDQSAFIFIHIAPYMFFACVFPMLFHNKDSLLRLRMNYPQLINKQKFNKIGIPFMFINN